MIRTGGAAAAILITLSAATFPACSEPGRIVERPLLDPLQQPDILVEASELEPPPSTSGNRFVHGWWGWVERDVLRLVAYRDPARVEVATLESRPRTLTFETKVHALPTTGAVEVTVDGETIATLPLDPGALELPPLPIGRQAVDFHWPEGSEVGIERASFEEALPAGRVDIGAESIRQGGYSIVDFVRRVPAGARLRGRLDPADDPRDGQRFAVHIENENGTLTERVVWPGRWWSRWTGGRFDIPLADKAGLVRIRLLATGTGDAAEWSGLTIAQPPTAEIADVAVPDPPRLVLLYVLDALRADFVGHLGGGEGVTPTLDRLAREGVTFTDHQSLAPNTLPSTQTLFSGRAVLYSGNGRLPEEGPPLLAEHFAEAGRRTGLFSGNIFVTDTYGMTRGFEHHDPSVLIEEHPRGRYNDNAEWVHAAAIDWLDTLRPDEPAFLYAHTIHPHNPYDPPPAFRPKELDAIPSDIDGGSGTLIRLRKGDQATNEADRERLRQLYRGSLSYADAELGALLEEILARYEPGDVLVLVTSDHGEELFDHGGLLHGFSLYRHQLHIPLLAWWPGTLDPRVVTAPTTTQDLYNTLRRLTGAYDPPPLSGRSLWPLLLGTQESEPRVRFAAAPGVEGGIFSAETPTRKLVWAPRRNTQWGMGTGPGRDREPEYVFDLTTDPAETVNRAGEPSLETEWLRGRLRAWIELAVALEPGNVDPPTDERVERNLRALGYLD